MGSQIKDEKIMGVVTPHVRLMVIQFGDYREALLARTASRPETYRAQYYSMACFDKVLSRGHGLIVCLDTEPYDQNWENIHLVGDRFIPGDNGCQYLWQARSAGKKLIALAKRFSPTHLIIRTPDWPSLFVGAWALQQKIPLLPLFADYFYASTLKNKIKNFPLIRILNSAAIPLVANHNYPACISMALAGVKTTKIVPYDWPSINNPNMSAPKQITLKNNSYRLCYAGQISTAKGVGDLLKALACLVESGIDMELDIFGTGPEKEAFAAMAENLHIGTRVRFHGLSPNASVLETMRQAHLVVVPSHHAYPEGIPCVIYESLEVRTPVVISDHPSFLPKFKHGEGCLIFEAGNVLQLATRIKECLTDPNRYASLSTTTASAWENIQCPVTFGQLLDDWIAFTSGKEAQLACRRYSLAFA
jgi:glycosyltransferase involved in cell wall biosynthesis